MCGIVGLTSLNKPGFPLEKAMQALQHRGPDDSGSYADDTVSLGQTRLSIIDLAGGGQPMSNEDGSKCIIFNGEIYNFQALRRELEQHGHRFQTRSDTETILHGYEQWGTDCLQRLQGMFAFAVWDKNQKRLFLARDRLGIKPLFFAEHQGSLYFASEMKAILADPRFPREMNESALAAYFSLSYIPAPQTVFKQISKLLPGHYLIWQDGRTHIHQYWDLRFAPDYSLSEDDCLQTIAELLEDAVKQRLMSEVPLGCFLSGGIDSGAVVALMSGLLDDPVTTFCMGFGGQAGGYLDERGYARMVADRYRTDHHEFEVRPEFEGLMDTIVQAFDEPFADDSTIPSYFVCQLAREKATVALSGLGGDEAFAGYERYLGLRLRGVYQRWVPKGLKTVLNRLAESLPERADGHYTINHLKRFTRSAAATPDTAYAGFLSILRPDLQRRLFSDNSSISDRVSACNDHLSSLFNSSQITNGADVLNRGLYTDFKTYLPEDILAVTDRMSMQHSLEVRVPFLDHRLVEFCATIPPGMKLKGLKKKALLKQWAKAHLPKEVIRHRKQGFVGPMTQWLKTDLKPMTETVLAPANLKQHGLFKEATVRRILDQHASGRENHDTLIWALVMFQRWFELYMQ
jgi:asparagine synthase (glutamine-hydrolysing)